MELVVFDLDGTLLNRAGEISAYTRETLAALAGRGIAYTVATGRTLHASRDLLGGHGFDLPQIFKNGVIVWDPALGDYSYRSCLTMAEIHQVMDGAFALGITPFVFTLEPGNRHAIYHTPLRNAVEERLKCDFIARTAVPVLPLSQIPADCEITNISALGEPGRVLALADQARDEPNLVAYTGTAQEGQALRWIDIHHVDGSKGRAVEDLRLRLGLGKVICFGDSDNDLSMFARADESYAPANAADSIREAATAVIGHHDEDGIAHFLRERFSL